MAIEAGTNQPCQLNLLENASLLEVAELT